MKKRALIILLVVTLGWLAYQKFSGAGTVDLNHPPQFIQADFIDLDRVAVISKFRSGSGHDFSGNGESCRSMKHYYNARRSAAEDELISRNQGRPPAFDPADASPIYSPVDGKIISVKSDKTDIGQQIYIRPDGYPQFTVRLFHIFPLDGYQKGKRVTAGESIGKIGRLQNTDIAVNVGSFINPQYISYFAVMPDSLFARYQALGINSRDELIISREYRDANPLKCNGEQFAVNYDGDPASGNFVPLKR